MLWLLMFAVVPLAFITGYSLVKYEQAIDQELVQRLAGNKREIQREIVIYKIKISLSISLNMHKINIKL